MDDWDAILDFDDRNRFAEVIARHRRSLIRLALAEGLTTHQAEDMVEDVILQVYRRWTRRTLERRGHSVAGMLRGWLYRNLDGFRRTSQREPESIPIDAGEFTNDFSTAFELQEDDPSHVTLASFFGGELFDRLQRESSDHIFGVDRTLLLMGMASGLAQLSDEAFVLLQLKYVEEWSYEEIAAEQRIAPSRVKNVLHDARQRLRSRLAAYLLQKGNSCAI